MTRLSALAFAAVGLAAGIAPATVDAQVRATAARTQATPTCEQSCAGKSDQRACVSACYSNNYRLQRARASSRLQSIEDVNDAAYEEDVRRNPYLTAAAKNAILDAKSKGYPGSRIPNATPGGDAIPADQPPLGLAPLKLVYVEHGSPAGLFGDVCQSSPCQLKEVYDLPPQWLVLSYRLTGISAAEAAEHINRVGFRRFDLVINNVKLVQGKSVVHGDDYLVGVLEEPCYNLGAETDQGCLFISIDPALFFPASPPYPNWAVNLEFTTTKPQIGPVNPAPKLKKPNLQKTSATVDDAAPASPQPGATPQDQRAIQAKPSTPVLPKPGQSAFPPRADFILYSYIKPPAYITSFWLKTIGETVSSARCTSCHAMDTSAKILDHHGFLSSGDIVMVPSALISGQQVHSCANCHACGPQKCSGGPLGGFDENRWATPTQGQNINWAQLINANPATWPKVVCQRMKSSLTTPQLREEHFHEDFRLFWAVADGFVVGPGGGPLETAPPHNYSTFLTRFDIWNDGGAPCPPG
jgi:hypothetical protein